jgi:hypothetical protein
MYKILGISIVAVLFVVAPAWAMPTTIWTEDIGHQDPLVLPNMVHELGDKPPFPDDEWIESSYTITQYTPCTQNPDNPGKPNIEVSITNMTTTFWYDLHYVSDALQEADGTIVPETLLSNDDGFVNGGLAFRIDWVGANTPLVFESKTVDTIFEPGETWRFVIQDFVSPPGGPPAPFDSIGVGIGSSGFPLSTGSIIATPEPATLLVLALGLIPALIRRRR